MDVGWKYVKIHSVHIKKHAVVIVAVAYTSGVHQVFVRWHLNVEACIQSQITSLEIGGGCSGTGGGFSVSFFVFPIIPPLPHSHLSMLLFHVQIVPT
jgi:hypothetical protein